MIEKTASMTTTPQERTWAMACHLAALAGITGIPFAHIFGPLVVWLIKKDDFPLVNDQGKEALNFQLSMTIYGLVALVLCFVLIGIPILIALLAFDFIMVIIACVKAAEGVPYRYPLTIRFIT
jgi:uncharacterized Tic20 family protein